MSEDWKHVWCFDYRCDRCNFRATAVHGARGYYRFDDGFEMHALTDSAWCNVCNDITSVESLRPIDEIRDEIDRLQKRDFNDWDVECAEAFHESIDDIAIRRIEMLTQHRNRFANRLLPNRCIECGFSDFETLRSIATSGDMPETFFHAKCGGILRQTVTCHAIPATYFVLDADGNRVSAAKTT